MNFIQRLGYYLGGFAIGLIFLSFFLSGKKTSCSYSPQARVSKNINLKNLRFSEDVFLTMQTLDISEALIADLVKKGKINFSKSNTKPDSCKIYLIENNSENKLRAIRIENCDKTATVLEINPK
jgi:hypothetical protein